MKQFQLDQHPKIDDGFRTPDGYFDTLPDAVFGRLARPETKVVRLRPLRSLWYAAAAVLVLALAIPLANRFYTPSAPDDAALENYLSTQSGLTQYELAELLTESDITALNADIPVDDAVLEETLSGNTNLEYYLTY